MSCEAGYKPIFKSLVSELTGKGELQSSREFNVAILQEAFSDLCRTQSRNHGELVVLLSQHSIPPVAPTSIV